MDKYLTHVTFTFGNSRKILSEHTVQLIPETTGMGHKCTLTVNPDRITDLQWQAMNRTLPDNLAEIAGEVSKISEIIST